MMPPPTSRSIAGDLPLKYVGGDPSLDLVNTVDWTDAGPERDRLPDYDRLTRWAEGAGLLTKAAVARVRATAVAEPRRADSALRRARRVRWVLRCVFTSLAAGSSGDQETAKAFADLLNAALKKMQLRRRGPAKRHDWVSPAATSTFDGFLTLVVWSAARLLASEEAESLRVCGGPDCGWLFVDRSRNGLRRWCEMQTCGTLEKTRRRRARA